MTDWAARYRELGLEPPPAFGGKPAVKEHTPEESALVRAAEDPNQFVRWGAASNPHTPPDALAKLAEDRDWRVRCAATGNPNTPPDALAKLAKDPDAGVREAAKANLKKRGLL